MRTLAPVYGLLFSTLIMMTASGLAFVVVPLRAQLEGWSPTTIGWLGSAFAAAFMAGCIITPKLVLRVGHVRVFAVLASLLCISILIHSVFVNVPAWLIARGMGGFALAGAYMIIESWLNEQSTNETRGTVFSVYMVINMGGLIAGQFLLTTGDPATTVLFIIAGILYAAAVIPTGLSNASSPQPLAEAKLDIRKLFANSPVAMTGAFATGAVWGSWNFHAPTYASGAGLSGAGIASMLAVAMLGGAFMQFPLGRMSDRYDRRLIIIGASLACVALALLLMASAPTGWPLYALMFAFGGVFMPIYSLVVAHGNDHAEPSDFVEISSGLLITYGVGSMIGPVATGLLIDAMGRSGLFVTIVAVYIPLVIFTLYRLTRRDAVAEEDRIDYQYAPPIPAVATPESYQFDPRSDEDGYSSFEEGGDTTGEDADQTAQKPAA